MTPATRLPVPMSVRMSVDAGGQLLQALLDGAPWEDLVRDCGADPDGLFCGAVSRAPQDRAWGPAHAWSVRLQAGQHTWVLAQVPDAAQLAQVAPGPAGVGTVRCGWAGARHSLLDAGQALGVCGGGTASFDDEWVLATVVAARDRLSDVCASAGAVAAHSSHLADAVLAFADHRLSVVGAARALQVHPNTVIYRLERWHGLTGWDPRTFRGLAASVACLQLTS